MGFERAGTIKPAPLIDPFQRAITYLRVSVTDRCDFRCVYCMSENMTFLPKPDLLTLEELDRHLQLGLPRRARPQPAELLAGLPRRTRREGADAGSVARMKRSAMRGIRSRISLRSIRATAPLR